jgi:hypothetical protein
MNVRQDVQRIVDFLPEDRLTEVFEFLPDLLDGDELLSPEAQAAIDEGLDDAASGRTIALMSSAGLAHCDSRDPAIQPRRPGVGLRLSAELLAHRGL